MEKIGVKAVAIKSGNMKDMASPLHDISPEERAVLESIITDFYEQFLAVVEKGRPNIDKSKLRELADGRVFTAQQALKQGLIDKIGHANDAIEWAKKLASIDRARTVIYHRPMDYRPNIYSSAMTSTSPITPLINVELPDWLNSDGAQFLYLWQPGL